MAWTAIRGQSAAVEALQASLKRGRVASASLFVGPDGVGKRLAAVELAKALNCQTQTIEACDRCASCNQIQRQVHPDVHVLAPHGSADMIGIDQVRGVLGRIALRPFSSRCQVVIVDGAERLTEEAANSFLKTLEEPTERTRLILLTSQPSRCLPTVRSRCQTVRFQRLTPELIETLLVAGDGCDPGTAGAVSTVAQGSMARARELVEGWPAYQAMVAQFGDATAARWLEWTVPKDRQELGRWLAASVLWLRDVTVAAVSDQALLSHREAAVQLHRQAQAWDVAQCMEAALRLIELSSSLDHMVSARLVGALLREQWLELVKGGGLRVEGSQNA